MATYCSAADLASMFPAAAGAPAPQLLLALTLGAAYLENYTQRKLALATYTHEQMPLLVNRQRQIVGKVRQWPVVSVTALSFLAQGQPVDPANEEVLDPRYVDFLSPPERLFYFSGPMPTSGWPRKDLRGVVYATYTAGFATIPDDLRMAAILLSQYALTLNANAVGAASISVSAPSSSNSISWDRKSALVVAAEQLLDAYVRRE